MTINCMHSIKDMIWVSWCVYVSTSFRCVVIISMQSCITFSPWCCVYDGRGGQLYNVFSSTFQKFPPELLKILVLSSPKMVHYQERGKNNNSCFFNPYIQVVSWPHFLVTWKTRRYELCMVGASLHLPLFLPRCITSITLEHSSDRTTF